MTEHEVVVEIREGDHLAVKCVPCRVVIPVRPISAAARLDELNRRAREHANARVRRALDGTP